jgi:hypothetical protein
MLPSVIGGPGGRMGFIHLVLGEPGNIICSLIITIWFAYLCWFLLVIFNLSSTVAVRAVVTIAYPATAITMWTDLHCRLLPRGVSPDRQRFGAFVLTVPEA